MLEIRVESEGFSWNITDVKVYFQSEGEMIIDFNQLDGHGYEEYIELNEIDKDKFNDIANNVRNLLNKLIKENCSYNFQELFNLINPLLLSCEWPLEED